MVCLLLSTLVLAFFARSVAACLLAVVHMPHDIDAIPVLDVTCVADALKVNLGDSGIGIAMPPWTGTNFWSGEYT